MRYEYDLVVIGSGAGGNVGAQTAVNMDKKVAIVEKGIVGGECPNFACVPTKALLHAAAVFDTVGNASHFGTKVSRFSHDDKLVHRWRNAVVSKTGTSRGEEIFKKAGIHLIKGTARFISAHEIAVGNKRITSDKFLVATGSSSFIPPIPGLIESGYITFEAAGDFEKLPKSIFILGGGPIGCEFTQIFSTFGVKVTIADTLPRLLAKEDSEVGEQIKMLFEKRGVTVLTEAKVTLVEKQGDKRVVHYHQDGKDHTVTAEKILVATGKHPNLDLDLERAGVMLSKHGIRVNQFLQTTVPNIYAAGDVIGPYLFTHVGEYQSEIAARNAFSYKKIKADYRVVPRCVYTNPEVASVGINETDAHEQGIRIQQSIFYFAELGRSKTSNELDGFVKVITDLRGTLLGGSIVGPRAGEIIHELALAIKLRATAEDVAGLIHAYPTFSEALKYACSGVAA